VKASPPRAKFGGQQGDLKAEAMAMRPLSFSGALVEKPQPRLRLHHFPLRGSVGAKR